MKQKETSRLDTFLVMTDHLYKSAFMKEAFNFSILGEQNSNYLAVPRVFTLLSHMAAPAFYPSADIVKTPDVGTSLVAAGAASPAP